MQDPVQTTADTSREDTFTRKARVLLDLFGPSGVERLRRAGLQTGDVPLEPVAPSDPALDTERLALLERFRGKGLFERNSEQRASSSATGPSLAPLTARVADDLDEGALEKEHPAIIAMVLKSQPSLLQRQALQALPGPVARATIRFLRG